jgi:branched-chain amino acid transport system ATP-binding protein/sulfate-transporting ATPase
VSQTPAAPAASAPLLEVSGLTVLFGGLTALDGLDLVARPGELLGLIGPNGSGKTTFFNAVTGFVRTAGGRVRFGGADITGAAPRQVARHGVARTFQRLRLLSELSVFDNLMLGLHLELAHGPWHNLFARRALSAEVASRAAQARELLDVFSPALAERLAEPLRALPMIDRRRVEICRALIRSPRLLLLDEPSAGMTPDETHALMADLQAVKARRPDTAVILIEHDMAVIERVSDRCMVLDYGRRLCEGSYAEVSRDPEVRRAYLGEA